MLVIIVGVMAAFANMAVVAEVVFAEQVLRSGPGGAPAGRSRLRRRVKHSDAGTHEMLLQVSCSYSYLVNAEVPREGASRCPIRARSSR